MTRQGLERRTTIAVEADLRPQETPSQAWRTDFDLEIDKAPLWHKGEVSIETLQALDDLCASRTQSDHERATWQQ